MYSEKTINASIEKFSVRHGWTPVRHSIEDVNEFNDYVKSISKIESNSRNSYVQLTKPLTQKRVKETNAWIQNEQAMCAIDYGYWESRYAYVRSTEGEIVRFKNWRAQEILDHVVADLDDQGVSIELIVAHARQAGATTKIGMWNTHRVLFRPNMICYVLSPERLQAELMETKSRDVYAQSPWWLVPYRSPKGQFDNGSCYSFHTTRSIPLRGLTPQVVQIIDADRISNPIRVIEEGVMCAVHSSRNTLLTIEGQLGKDTEWFTGTYHSAKNYWPKGNSRLCPVFIPWYACSDIYPSRQWIEKFPVPTDFKPAKETKHHVVLATQFVRLSPVLTKVLGQNWVMPIEQQWFWEKGHTGGIHCSPEEWKNRMAPSDSTVQPEKEWDAQDFDELFPSSMKIQAKVAEALAG